MAACGNAFFKPNDGGCGAGTGLLIHQADARWHIRTNQQDRADLSWDEVLQLLEKEGDDLIVQPMVRNHHELTDFGEHALHTVRIVTVQLRGVVVALHACLKIAAPDSVIDNYITGGTAVAIDIDDGMLGRGARKAADSLPASADSLANGVTFAGRRLPFWRELLSLAIRLHKTFPDFASLGHDIAITPQGPSVIEVNPIWDGGIFQKTLDIGLISTAYADYVEDWVGR